MQYTIGKKGITQLESFGGNYSKDKHIVFKPNSCILGIGIEEIGVSKDLIGCCSPIYKTYTINSNIIDTNFIKIFINLYLDRVKRFVTQKSTRREYEFDYNALNKIYFFIPNINRQKEISRIFKLLQNKLQNEKDILLLYKKQKAYLLSNMFI